jgi:dihydroorotate dehydrogenase (fumarate)
MPDLTTTYMGLTLKNPIVPSASPLSKRVSTIRQMEDAGAAAITMDSLFEEQIDIEALFQHNFPERFSCRPRRLLLPAADLAGADGYLDRSARPKPSAPSSAA